MKKKEERLNIVKKDLDEMKNLDVLFLELIPSQYDIPGAGSACTMICLSVAYWLSTQKNDPLELRKMELDEIMRCSVEVYDSWITKQKKEGKHVYAYATGLEAIEFDDVWRTYLSMRFNYNEISGKVNLFDPVVDEGVFASLEQLVGAVHKKCGAILTFCHYSFLLWNFGDVWMFFDPHGMQSKSDGTSHFTFCRNLRVLCAEMRQVQAMTSKRFVGMNENFVDGIFSSIILSVNKE